MDRATLRDDFIRVEADELTAANEGLFTDAQLNNLINIAQRRFQAKVFPYISWYFRKSKVFGITINVSEYAISATIGITDLFLFETVVHNKANYRQTPLYYLDNPEDISQYTYLGGTNSDPKGWGYADKDTIFITPTPSATVADRLKAWYFKKVPDLNHDTSDVSPNVATPHFPECLHELIGYEVLMRWFIRDREGADYNRIKELYAESWQDAMYTLSSKQGFTTGRLPGAKEYLEFDNLSENVRG